LRRILSDPSDFFSHIRRYAGSLTLAVIYGYEPSQSNDQFIDMAEDCVDILANEVASGGGIWPVDVFPSLQYLPKWMPGAGFLRKAEVWKKKMEDFVDLPYEFVKIAMVGHYMRLLDLYRALIFTDLRRNQGITSLPSVQRCLTTLRCKLGKRQRILNLT
jgi:hypothetical protein